jgi:haloalkane dehalogenase
VELLRTPEERFGQLPGWPFAPRFAEVEGLRIHYVDEGPRTAPVVLLLHGEPSWSYLYRKMIPPLVQAGLRCVAPDLVGFGRSDKPAHRADYTYARHVAWMAGLLEQLDLRGVTLFCQDWGGLIGLRLLAERGDRFARAVAANTFLPTGEQRVPRAFRLWRGFARWTPLFPTGRIVATGCAKGLTPEERLAYDAPYPSSRYQAGARAFPLLVPTEPDAPGAADNRRAWEALRRWEKPFLTLFGARDPITRGADKVLQREIPGARGQPHARVDAGHFLQEDAGPELAGRVAAFVGATG